MIRATRFVAPLLVFAASGFAAAQTAPVPPPPDIHDPGVGPARAVTVPAPAAIPAPARAASVRVPPGTPVHEVPAGASTALPPEATPDVTIRQEGDDTVQEYRHNGQLYMIRVIPKHGIPQTYMDTDGDGRLERPPGTRRGVAPVYYTIYQWDKPPKPATSSSAD